MEGLPRYQSFLSSNCRSFDSRAATFTYWSSSKWQNQLKLNSIMIEVHKSRRIKIIHCTVMTVGQP